MSIGAAFVFFGTLLYGFGVNGKNGKARAGRVPATVKNTEKKTN